VGYYVGSVAVITGAGSGIGRALAVDLAGRGARLALSDRDGAAVAETARQCRLSPARVRADAVDVTDRPAVLEYASSVADDFGAVDMTFSVAGIIHTGSVLESRFSDIEQVLAVNFWGVVNITKAFLPYVIESKCGHIVNISSAFGLMSAPRYSAYNSSKFAVRGFTESLRQEMTVDGRSVHVTCVYPGGVRTAIMRNGLFAAGENPAAVADSFDRKVARMTPEKAATRILSGVERGQARVLVGADAYVVSGVLRVLGGTYQNMVPSIARLLQRPAGRAGSDIDTGAR
jgi:short-subunit dehydrogenase